MLPTVVFPQPFPIDISIVSFGYTKTSKISVTPGQEINIQVASIGGNTIIKDTVAATGSNGQTGYITNFVVSGNANGGDGGSGGGGGSYFYHASSWCNSNINGGYHGSDGGNGNAGNTAGLAGTDYLQYIAGGAGQGTTTRAFKESGGTLYASGGDGGDILATVNDNYHSTVQSGSNGNSETNGQGIAIIRWGY